MTQYDGAVVVGIMGDNSEFAKSLRETNDKLRDFSGEIDIINRSLQLNPGNVELMGQKFAALGNQINLTRDKLDQLKSAEQEITQKFANGEIGAEQYNAFRREILNTEAALQNLIAAQDSMFDESGRLRDVTNELNPEIEETGKQAKKSGSEITNFSDAISSMAKKVITAKAALDTAKITINAIKSITKAAVANYGEYEQLVGGVETLFGDSANTVQEYAAKAYESAGLSANQYMETVTSFSASLLQSLSGDTEAAAKVANKAITDMADNANKMGTDKHSIQNAYQGFAKDNYTMLDNLKLGYGGTKEEMQRLLDTANEYNRQQGINTNYQIESYADIVEAIHVVQTEMGITGTTAAEASDTIRGSLSSVKAAWQNLLTGIADENADFDGLINNFVESAATALDNLLPRVNMSLKGIGKLVKEISPIIADAFPELVDDVAPELVQTAVDLITTLVNALVDNGDITADAALDILDMLVKALEDNASKITVGAVALIVTLIKGISDRSPDLINAAVTIVMSVVKGITDNTGALTDAALQLIISLGTGLIMAIPQLWEASREIPESIADSIINYDWNTAARSVMTNIADALDKAQKEFQIWLDNTFSDGAVYGGDIANVDTTGFVKNMREGIDILTSESEEYSQKISKPFSTMADEISKRGKESEKAAKNAAENTAKALDDGGNEIAETTKKSGEKQKSVLVQNMEALERLYKQRQITEEEYQKRRLEYLEKNRDEESDEWTKYYDSVQTYYEKVAKTEQQAAETAAKKVQQSVEKSISNIIKQWQNSYNELEKKRENYRKKLLSVGGDIFSVDEIENPDGTKTKQYTVNNIDEQIKKMREYNSAVKKLKESGVSDALLTELTSMSDEDSQQFAKYLSEMSEEELTKINELYSEKQRVADELSRDLYANEYAAIADGINTALDEVSAGAADKGKEAAESYAKAFGETLLKHSEDFYPLLGDEKYKKWFGTSDDAPNLFNGIGGDISKLMQLFTGANFADIAAKVTSTVRAEQARYSAPAYTAAVASAAPDTASASDSRHKSDIAAILEKLNKPLPIMLDGKVIAEAVMTYQNNYMRKTGG